MPGKADPATFPLVPSPGNLACPFPYFGCPASRQMTGIKRETPVEVREVGAEADAPTPSNPLPLSQSRHHLPERPHWHKVVGQGMAATAPGKHRAASCGKLRGQSWSGPQARCPRPSWHIHTSRSATSAAVAPLPEPSSPPASLNRSARRCLEP